MNSKDLVDDALSKISELGTVGAMKWLAQQYEEIVEEYKEKAWMYDQLNK